MPSVNEQALLAFALRLIKQRLRLIYLTIQAKQGQSEQLQLTKNTATKSLMRCERRHERIEILLEQIDASHVPVEGVQNSDDEDEDPVPSARSARARARSLANKLTMIVTPITTSEEQVQEAQDALKITTRDI